MSDPSEAILILAITLAFAGWTVVNFRNDKAWMSLFYCVDRATQPNTFWTYTIFNAVIVVVGLIATVVLLIGVRT